HLIAAALLPLAQPSHCHAVHYPGHPPGPPVIRYENNQIIASNSALSVALTCTPNELRLRSVTDVQKTETLPINSELFRVISDRGQHRFTPTSKPRLRNLGTRPSAALAEVQLQSTDARLHAAWRAILRDGANYIRQEITITNAGTDRELKEVVFLDATAAAAQPVGHTDGSPFIAGNFFLGLEDPHATGATNGRISFQLPCQAALQTGESFTFGAVIGVAPQGQLRRAFLCYIERERAHPYRPYLHYNSWYDISWPGELFTETTTLEAVRLWGEHFIKAHRVVMDGMVLDDGWDDPKTLWQFHAGFPNGFERVARLCRRYHTRPGVWLSPFGGYGELKKQRLQYGKQHGYEINDRGFSLAGPKYYAAFKQVCVQMIRRYGVNHFKFDGIAAGARASGAQSYLADTQALRRLMLELRKESPGVFINFTTGSWPSPFWLRYADSIWRQGHDMGHAGKGSKQQQWLTYRDQEVYRNIVGKGPLFPLSSLMTQGVAYSRHGPAGDPTFNSEGFKYDVRAFFGSGTCLQELYIQPGKLTPQDWAVLAEAAKWARANADVFPDVHWIGGDPSKLQVYGYAAWSARKAVLTLRNPDDRTQEFALDVATAFELPQGAPTKYQLKSPWAEDAHKPPLLAEAGRPTTIVLRPFEVLVLDALPVK
ncbi:MAG: enterotoxin, partial [Verrucomicrobiae bacterium]|nr:enterotoxin [Verrucomicrobiae bacterium]